jgi:hypothetical protein
LASAYWKNKAPGPDEFRAECLQAMDDLTVNYIIKLYGASINFTLHAEMFFSSHLLDSSTGPLGTAYVQLEKGGRIRNIYGFRVNCKGSNNKKAKELRQLKKSHEDK